MHKSMSEHIDSIIQKQKQKQEEQAEKTGLTFFQTSRIEGADESFLEIRFRTGIKTAFSYPSLAWFNLDPAEGMLDLGFAGFVVTLYGRGLTELFQAIKNKKVAWVREADEGMQDIDEFTVFISEITITPPSSFGAEEEASSSDG